MHERRKFLLLAGGGMLLAAGGAAAWAATRDPAKARKPWDVARRLQPGQGDPRLYALSHAILAPNPHNRQPWIADTSKPDAVTLFFDTERRLPHTDPFDRQLTIGLGCFVELLSMAAAETGHRAEVELFPDGEPQPNLDKRRIAEIRFVRDADAKRDPLFAHVFNRRTNRLAYDMTRPVPQPAMLALAAAAGDAASGYVIEAGRVNAIRAIAWQAMEIELRTQNERPWRF